LNDIMRLSRYNDIRQAKSPRGNQAPTQAGVAPTPNGHGAKPKRKWRQTQIHANFFQ
jgi:hypothetical protein